MTKGHFEFCWRIFQDVSRQIQKQMSILVVIYSLLQQGIYPVPVERSIQAMKHILEDIRKPPSRMLLAGDSAGAIRICHEM